MGVEMAHVNEDVTRDYMAQHWRLRAHTGDVKVLCQELRVAPHLGVPGCLAAIDKMKKSLAAVSPVTHPGPCSLPDVVTAITGAMTTVAAATRAAVQEAAWSAVHFESSVADPGVGIRVVLHAGLRAVRDAAWAQSPEMMIGSR